LAFELDETNRQSTQTFMSNDPPTTWPLLLMPSATVEKSPGSAEVLHTVVFGPEEGVHELGSPADEDYEIFGKLG
jgi:hypothetical protein